RRGCMQTVIPVLHSPRVAFAREVHMAPGSRAATAVLLEMSDKTRGPDLIPAMRQAALALHELVQRRFAPDPLYLVAFSYIAQEVTAEQLVQYTWPGGQAWANGTNIQHALTVA